MTVAELHFYERVPNLIADLVSQVKSLTKEVSELKEEIKKVKEEK